MRTREDSSTVPDGTVPVGTRPGDGTTAGGPDRVTERAPDDSDVGWGERPEEHDRDARYLEDRPPHWGSD